MSLIKLCAQSPGAYGSSYQEDMVPDPLISYNLTDSINTQDRAAVVKPDKKIRRWGRKDVQTDVTNSESGILLGTRTT